MRHPNFFEPAFDVAASAWEAGLQGAAPLAGVGRGVPCFSFSSFAPPQAAQKK